jgi:Uma2 family endonuclease
MALVMPVEVEEPMPTHGPPFTRADLRAMPEDGRRHEIIDGVLIVSAAPGRLHQRVSRRLTVLLDAACPAQFEVFAAPFSVALAEDTEMQPDLLVGRQEDFTDRDLPAPPVLAVEILSPSSRIIDSQLKRARFERAGTPDFWIVDPVANPAQARLTAWRLGPDDAYRQVADVVGDEKFSTEVPYPVTVVPADLVR